MLLFCSLITIIASLARICKFYTPVLLRPPAVFNTDLMLSLSIIDHPATYVLPSTFLQLIEGVMFMNECQLLESMRDFQPRMQQPGMSVGAALLHWRNVIGRRHVMHAYTVARMLGIDPASVSRLETGKQNPSIITLTKFVALYRPLLQDECATQLSLHACVPLCPMPDAMPTPLLVDLKDRPYYWRLKELRNEANIANQRFVRTSEIAAACGVTSMVISRIEQGESSGTVKSLRTIYQFFRSLGLDISLDHVLVIAPTKASLTGVESANLA